MMPEPFHLSSGMRAMSIAVDEVKDVSGLIQPGDHIDVYAVTPRMGEEPSEAFAILRDIVVLGVGGSVTDAPAVQGQQPTQWRSVTLQVSARASQSARDRGHECDASSCASAAGRTAAQRTGRRVHDAARTKRARPNACRTGNRGATAAGQRRRRPAAPRRTGCRTASAVPYSSFSAIASRTAEPTNNVIAHPVRHRM